MMNIAFAWDIKSITQAANKYNVKVEDLMRIAVVESRNTHGAVNHNKNGTVDIGTFQINSIHFETTCKKYDIYTAKGNALCAAKILSSVKKFKATDSQWQARYHSSTPSKKQIYYKKFANSIIWVNIN